MEEKSSSALLLIYKKSSKVLGFISCASQGDFQTAARLEFFLKKPVNVLAVQKLEAHDRYLKSSIINEVIRAISTLFIFFLGKDFTQKKA